MNKFVKRVALLTILMVVDCQAFAHDVVYYYYNDAQGTPVAMTDASGNVIERTQYTPYGQVLNRALRDGPGYTSHEEDPGTGLVYMQQRYYDPTIGRFLSMDPVGANTATGSNFDRYWYANDNPYRYTDPDGRCPDEHPCMEAAPESAFHDTLSGKLSNAVGNVAALFSSNNENPINHTVPSQGDLQDAKLSLLTLAAPVGKAEQVTADAVKAVEPMARGIASEARVLADMALAKNTTVVSTAEGRAIPDALTSTASYEIKDAVRVSATAQVRIQTGAARAAGIKSVLVTGKNTQISGPAQRAFDQIITRTDLGPQQ